MPFPRGVSAICPPIEELQNPKDKLASEIYSADMVPIGRFYLEQGNRISIDYDQISQPMIDALLATEDVRFYEHSGVDFKALLRLSSSVVSCVKRVRVEVVPSPSSWPSCSIRPRPET